jgi:uncharacterized protein YerC
MIKIDYEFIAKTPIHTGSDVSSGIIKTLRKQKIMIDPVEIKTTFANQEERITCLVEILLHIFKSIDFDKIKGQRLMKIWDEFHNKIKHAAGAKTRFQFLQIICEQFGIESLKENLDVIKIIDRFNDDEFFETIRTESHYLVLKTRSESKRKNKELTLFETSPEEKEPYKKIYEYIPCISGNSIRGVMRRLVMYDFIEKCGIEKIDKSLYHMLFTGGILNESTQYENIEQRESLIAMCPAIGVFGSAIGNMTIEGMLSVGMAYPKCIELGTGIESFWSYLDTIFQTRHDSSKTEKRIDIGEKDFEEIIQMKYMYEVFTTGTIFTHGFRMQDFNKLSVSCFWHSLRLLKENNMIGGMASVGNAEIDLSNLEIPEDEGKLYVDYLEENKIKIKDFFSV